MINTNYEGDGKASKKLELRAVMRMDLLKAREMTAKNSALFQDLNDIIENELVLFKKGKGDKNRLFREFIGTILTQFGVDLINNTDDEAMKELYRELTVRITKHVVTASDYSARDYKIFMTKVEIRPRGVYLTHMILSCIDVYAQEILNALKL